MLTKLLQLSSTVWDINVTKLTLRTCVHFISFSVNKAYLEMKLQSLDPQCWTSLSDSIWGPSTVFEAHSHNTFLYYPSWNIYRTRWKKRKVKAFSRLHKTFWSFAVFWLVFRWDSLCTCDFFFFIPFTEPVSHLLNPGLFFQQLIWTSLLHNTWSCVHVLGMKCLKWGCWLFFSSPVFLWETSDRSSESEGNCLHLNLSYLGLKRSHLDLLCIV